MSVAVLGITAPNEGSDPIEFDCNAIASGCANATGSGAAGAAEAFFFFFERLPDGLFWDCIEATPAAAAAQQQHTSNVKHAHCQGGRYDPEEPESTDSE